MFAEPATWLGGPITLREPSPTGTGAVIATVQPGAPVIPLWRTDDALFVMFPPVPYAMQLTAEQANFVRVPVRESTLTPDALLDVLRDPSALTVLKQLVETRKSDLQAAARPLVAPLIEAFASPEYRPMIQAFLPQLGLG